MSLTLLSHLHVFSVTREGGTFGGVQVNYELYNSVTKQLAKNGGDFLIVENLNLRFDRGERTKMIMLTPLIDNRPEVDVTYGVTLTSVQG